PKPTTTTKETPKLEDPPEDKEVKPSPPVTDSFT
ncbi:unnamed protein product, partial [marine sediment metagenome]